MNTKKPKTRTVQSEDSIESLNRLTGDFKKAAVQESKNLVHDLWRQVLKPSDMPEVKESQNQKQQQTKRAGDLKPGEELSLKEEEKQLRAIEPAINYIQEIVHAERKVQARDQHETKIKIQEIIIEIRKLTKSSKELAVQFKDIEKMEYVPENAGKYHANFVEWVLSMVRSARERVDNAISWTNAIKSKKSQKQYWSLFKKHGTKFALSGERYMVTQTG